MVGEANHTLSIGMDDDQYTNSMQAFKLYRYSVAFNNIEYKPVTVEEEEEFNVSPPVPNQQSFKWLFNPTSR